MSFKLAGVKRKDEGTQVLTFQRKRSAGGFAELESDCDGVCGLGIIKGGDYVLHGKQTWGLADRR